MPGIRQIPPPITRTIACLKRQVALGIPTEKLPKIDDAMSLAPQQGCAEHKLFGYITMKSTKVALILLLFAKG